MDEIDYDRQFNEAARLRGLIDAAEAEELPDLLMAASKLTLILRHTAIQEHLRVCQAHSACGWFDAAEPFNVRNDESWGSAPKLVLVAAVQEGIRSGTVTPWLPTAPPANPNPEDYPLYRAR